MTAWAWASIGLVLLGAVCATFSLSIHRCGASDFRRVRWFSVDCPCYPRVEQWVEWLGMPEYICWSYLAMLFVFVGWMFFLWVVP